MVTAVQPSRALSERLVEFSRDQGAFREYRDLFFKAKALPFWKHRERRELERRSAAARERAVAAGVDFSMVPRPPATLRVPDRSKRRKIGRAAPVNRLAADDGDAAGFAGTPLSAGTGALGGLALFSLLSGTPALAGPTSEDARGVWKEHEGDLYYTDPQGEVFQRGDDGSFQAVGTDGLLWSQGADVSMRATDGSGNTWSMNEQGDLSGVDANGQQWFLGDDRNAWVEGTDGGFYTVGADGALYGAGANGDLVAANPGAAGLGDGGVDAGVDDGGGWDMGDF
jgi:hypothetical protein